MLKIVIFIEKPAFFREMDEIMKHILKNPYTKLLTSLLLFGMNGIVASHIALSSYQIVFCRTALGSILLLLFFFAKRQHLTAGQHPRALLFLAASSVAMGVSWMLLFEGFNRIGVSLSTLLYDCGPVIVMLLSPLLFKEKLTAAKLLGFAAVLGGFFLINGELESAGGDRIGVICALFSAVTYAAMIICSKKAAAIKGLENVLFQLLFACLTVTVFVALRGGFPLPVDRASLPWILLLGIVNSGIGCYLYFSSIGALPVQTVAICGYLEPLSAVLFSVLLLGETLTLPQSIGAVLILGGAALGELWHSRKTTPTP